MPIKHRTLTRTASPEPTTHPTHRSLRGPVRGRGSLHIPRTPPRDSQKTPHPHTHRIPSKPSGAPAHRSLRPSPPGRLRQSPHPADSTPGFPKNTAPSHTPNPLETIRCPRPPVTALMRSGSVQLEARVAVSRSREHQPGTPIKHRTLTRAASPRNHQVPPPTGLCEAPSGAVAVSTSREQHPGTPIKHRTLTHTESPEPTTHPTHRSLRGPARATAAVSRSREHQPWTPIKKPA